jgi:phosphopantetheinyl transferase
MPLFYQHNINQTKLAVWIITEPEGFFLEKVHLRREINHPHKRLQHLAGRYLLQLLNPGFPLHLIEIADSNKPLLMNEEFHFSISHCGDFAAAIVSENNVVGIDVELIQAKIEFIKHKFLSEAEQRLLPAPDAQMLTLLWSSKEAVYKWYGRGGVDFKNHILIKNISITGDTGMVTCRFMKEMEKDLNVEFHLFRGLCLAWVTERR